MTAQAPTVHVPRRAFPWGKLAAWIALGILLVVTLFPFYWMLRTALTFPTSVYKDTSSLLPVDATLINFKRVLGMLPVQQLVELGGTGQSINFFLALRNSIIVSVLMVIGQVAFCAMAAYAFARLRFPFRNQIFAIYIAAMMVPGIVMTIPNFIFIRNLGWIDTFALPKKGKAEDAAYQWINFVMQPEIAARITRSAGNFTASLGSDEFVDDQLKAQFKASFPPAAIDNIKWYPAVPAGLEELEGKVLDRIQAAR